MESAITILNPTPKTGDNPALTTPVSKSGIERLANKDTFLKLLVAQLRNQNPLDPVKGTEFLAQLTGFSELEQMIEIRSELEAIRRAVTKAATEAPASGRSVSGQAPNL